MRLLAGPRRGPAAVATAVARVGIALVLAAGAANLAPPASAADGAVLIQDFSFRPATVTVLAGEGVTWTMGTDPEQHTVTPDVAGAFPGSGLLSTAGAMYTVTFATSGTYPYHCSLHSSMHGTVIVTTAATSPTPVSPTGTTAPPTAGEDVSPAPSATATAAPSSTGPAPGAGGPVSGASGGVAIVLAIAAMAVLGVALLRLRSR